jgi:hypothetical protein
MGKISRPLPVKLIIGLIGNTPEILEKTKNILIRKYGPVDRTSALYAFDLTDYYTKEMGPGLKRQFLGFKKLVACEKLVSIKRSTNTLETKLSLKPGARDINIDPGYISLSKLVLATTKSFVHRIYAGKGIFEEVTLYFKNNSFQAGPWTYPDYRSESHILFFNEVRDIYYAQIEKTYGVRELYRCV